MRAIALGCLLALPAWADVLLKRGPSEVGGVTTNLGPVTSIACAGGVSCSRSGSTGYIFMNGFYEAPAATTFYVDQLGNDNNDCTSTGVAACLTLQGVYAKIPFTLRNNVTINISSGAHSFSSRFAGRQFSTSDVAGFASVTVDIVGAALTDITPATGTATGTLTGATTGAAPLPVFTDSTQTWTTNDLRGYFYVATSGAQNGTSRPIVSNTGTTITTAPWNTAPISGTTYAIRTPATVITGSQGITGAYGEGSISGAFKFRRITFTSSVNSVFTVYAIKNSHTSAIIGLHESRALHTGTSNPIAVLSSPPIQGNASSTGGWFYAQSAGSGASAIAMSDVYGSGITVFAVGYNSNASLSSTVGVIDIRNNSFISMAQAGIIGVTAAAAGVPVFIQGTVGDLAGAVSSTIHASCPAGSTGTGIYVPKGGFSQRNVEVVNCGTGVRFGSTNVTSNAEDGQQISIFRTSLHCNGTTTCVSIARGNRVVMSIVPTLTGVTNDYNVDGVNYSESFFGALSIPRIHGASGSFLERQ